MNQTKRRNKKNKKSSSLEVNDDNDIQNENTNEEIQDSPDSKCKSAPTEQECENNIKNKNFDNQNEENLENIDKNENLDQKDNEIHETKVTESEEINPESENKEEFQEKQNFKNIKEEKHENFSENINLQITEQTKQNNKNDINIDQLQLNQTEKNYSEKIFHENDINNSNEGLDRMQSIQQPLQSGQNNQQDISSDKSKSSSSLNDFFTFSRQYNAMRIQSQIAQMQVNAVEYAKSLIQLGRRFYTIIRRLNNSSLSFFNSLFSIMGYSYKLSSNAANLFVFTSQAWLIDLSQLLDSKIKSFNTESLENFKFSDIFRLIKENETKVGVTPERELIFLNNLGVLTGNLLIERQHSSSFTMIENNIGKNFLKSMTFVIMNTLEPIEEEVDNRRFEEILFYLFKKGVEHTLNSEIQSEIFIEFDAIYENMKKECEKELNHINSICFESYSNKIKDFYSQKLNKQLNAFEISKLKICCETFFEIAQLSLDDILKDISMFIKNYSSVLFKLKRFLSESLNKYKKISNKLITKAEGVFQTVEEKFNLIPGKDRLVSLYLLTEGLVSNKINSGKLTMKRNMCNLVNKGAYSVNSLRTWVEESFDYMKNLNILNNNLLYLPYLTNIPSIISNGRGLLGLLESSSIYKFSISKFEIGYERYTNIRNNILHLSKIMLNKTIVYAEDGVKFISKYKIIKVDEKHDRIDILINKEFMLINPEQFFKIYNIINDVIQYGMKKVGDLTYKNYVIRNLYKNFLNSDISKSNESVNKENIEMTKLREDSKPEIKELKEIPAAS